MTTDDRSSRCCAPTPSVLSACKCSPRRRTCFPTGAVRQRPWASRERDASALAPLVDPRQPAHDRARRRAARARRQPLGGLGSSPGVRRRCDGKPLARMPREPGAHQNPHEIAPRLPRDWSGMPRDWPEIGPRTRWSHRTSQHASAHHAASTASQRCPSHALEPSHLLLASWAPSRRRRKGTLMATDERAALQRGRGTPRASHLAFHTSHFTGMLRGQSFTSRRRIKRIATRSSSPSWPSSKGGTPRRR